MLVNGKDGDGADANFAEWEVVFRAETVGTTLTAFAEDAAGNVEKRPHVVTVPAEN